eukprot:gene10120-biopygen13821
MARAIGILWRAHGAGYRQSLAWGGAGVAWACPVPLGDGGPQLSHSGISESSDASDSEESIGRSSSGATTA